jgi:serine acetyltransferase
VEIGDNVVIGAGCVIYKSIKSDVRIINQQNQLLEGRKP